VTLDLNGGAETFLAAAKIADKLPDLRIVVNHMGNPSIDGKEPPEAWRKAVGVGAAAGKNVWSKLSALVEGSGQRDGKAPRGVAFYRPTLDVLWNAFGADRLLFGSNWPVSDAFASYATVFDLAAGFVKSKGKVAFDKVFGGNAKSAYQLTRG
jgi:predicted TIM-barrel fold metal-dependent hydrolase